MDAVGNPPRHEATVAAEDLTLAYGERVAVADASFTLRAGTATSLIGPNGSGKSTLLHAVAGLQRPLRGSVRVLDADPADVRPRVAYVLQATTAGEHLPVTVREAIAMGRYGVRGMLGRFTREDRRLVDEAMARLDLGRLARRHLSELSGGQRQRVFVAQGLVQRADVLLLDEPLAGVDLGSGQAILSAVAEERDRGCTVITSTHDLAEAAGADHLLLLAGRLVAAGPPSEVLTREHLADAYGAAVLHLGGEALVIDDGSHHLHDRPAAQHADHGAHEHRSDRAGGSLPHSH